jgi:hypothetical protein
MSGGFGTKETDKLRANIESQLNRLLAQLQDLDDLKDVSKGEEEGKTMHMCTHETHLSLRNWRRMRSQTSEQTHWSRWRSLRRVWRG